MSDIAFALSVGTQSSTIHLIGQLLVAQIYPRESDPKHSQSFGYLTDATTFSESPAYALMEILPASGKILMVTSLKTQRRGRNSSSRMMVCAEMFPIEPDAGTRYIP